MYNDSWDSVSCRTQEKARAYFEKQDAEEETHHCEECRYWTPGVTKDCGRCHFGNGSSAAPYDRCARWQRGWRADVKQHDGINFLFMPKWTIEGK